MPRFAPLATVVRNGQPESWHFGAVAAATPEGRLVAFQGDPEAATFLRSATKPFQCLPLVLAGGAERFGLEPADLALICASHGGTPAHARRAADLLARGGFGEKDLLCGAHWPLDEEAARQLRDAGEAPTALHNNCSGKHAGMLLACRMLDLPVSDYTAADHPWQRRILDHVTAFFGVPEEAIGFAVDGCSVPTYRVPLSAAARAYAALADPNAADIANIAGIETGTAAAVSRIVRAMTGVPEMVAGPGRFTTRLMEVTGGRVLGKEGAEGFYGVAVRGPVALGIAVKIADGGERCRDGVVLDVLRQLGSLSGAEFHELAAFHRKPLHNHRGIEVGEVLPEVDLEEV